jgi:hypothetical protein
MCDLLTLRGFTSSQSGIASGLLIVDGIQGAQPCPELLAQGIKNASDRCTTADQIFGTEQETMDNPTRLNMYGGRSFFRRQ